jgi:hypothetical protein
MVEPKRGCLTLLFLLLASSCTSMCTPSSNPTPASGTPGSNLRFIIGGDSRDDSAHVLPWAFREAQQRGAQAFFFLGDMELSPQLDEHFRRALPLLGPVTFYPALGNHEVRVFGEVSMAHAEAEAAFKRRFLDTPSTPIHSSIDKKVVYGVTLAGGVHLIALDNVSQKGFGADQLTWLQHDLEQARATPSVRFIIVGMHKPLAHNGVSAHSMEEDGPTGAADSDLALALLVKYRVSLIVASHVHGYAAFQTSGIPSYITGGLGAPLVRDVPGIESVHHFLQVEVVGNTLEVAVVRFDGKPSQSPEEAEGKE